MTTLINCIEKHDDCNKEAKPFHTVMSGVDDNDKNSISATSVDTKIEQPAVLPILVNSMFDMNKLFEVQICFTLNSMSYDL